MFCSNTPGPDSSRSSAADTRNPLHHALLLAVIPTRTTFAVLSNLVKPSILRQPRFPPKRGGESRLVVRGEICKYILLPFCFRRRGLIPRREGGRRIWRLSQGVVAFHSFRCLRRAPSIPSWFPSRLIYPCLSLDIVRTHTHTHTHSTYAQTSCIPSP